VLGGELGEPLLGGLEEFPGVDVTVGTNGVGAKVLIGGTAGDSVGGCGRNCDFGDPQNLLQDRITRRL
jgi:hypothetical protein